MSLSPEERAALRKKFVEYKANNSRKLRNELIEAHRSLASHLARQVAHRGGPIVDQQQVGYHGMLKEGERVEHAASARPARVRRRRGRRPPTRCR